MNSLVLSFGVSCTLKTWHDGAKPRLIVVPVEFGVLELLWPFFLSRIRYGVGERDASYGIGMDLRTETAFNAVLRSSG